MPSTKLAPPQANKETVVDLRQKIVNLQTSIDSMRDINSKQASEYDELIQIVNERMARIDAIIGVCCRRRRGGSGVGGGAVDS